MSAATEAAEALVSLIPDAGPHAPEIGTITAITGSADNGLSVQVTTRTAGVIDVTRFGSMFIAEMAAKRRTEIEGADVLVIFTTGNQYLILMTVGEIR